MDLSDDNSIDFDNFFIETKTAKGTEKSDNKITGIAENFDKIPMASSNPMNKPVIVETVPALTLQTGLGAGTTTATATASTTKFPIGPRKAINDMKRDSNTNIVVLDGNVDDDNDDDDNDDDDDLGFDPRRPKAPSKAQNLIDEILLPLNIPEQQRSLATRSGRIGISRQSNDNASDTSNIFQNQANFFSRPKTSIGKRDGSLSATNNTGPLDLFGKDNISNDKLVTSSDSKIEITAKSRKKITNADWLGLNVDRDADVQSKFDMTADQRPPSKDKNIKGSAPDAVEEIDETPAGKSKEQLPMLPGDTVAQNIACLNTLNLETKQSLTNLKYQELQLQIACQMKQQEKALLEMQRKQDVLLQQQESQFQTLLQQQIQRQQNLEGIIAQQQQRLNSHIQFLMNESTLPIRDYNLPILSVENRSSTKLLDDVMADDLRGNNRHSNFIEIEADNKRLHLENLRLEEQVANSRLHYDKEIELLEKSYKKQIEVLDQHLVNLEQRLKTEIDDVERHFTHKIDNLDLEKQSIKKAYEDEIFEIKKSHEEELADLRRTHNEDLQIIREEHRRMLETIRQAKLMEFAAIQENGSYVDTLRLASADLENLTGGFQELRDSMQTKLDTLNMEREKKLESRERLVEDAEKRLRISEEAAESEKQRLLDLVSTMELQMTKISKDSSEESWQLRQKMASLDAEKDALTKEKEFFREQILRDERRLKDLKEHQLLEFQRIQTTLQEEKKRLQIERAQFEMEKRLQSNADLDKERMEVETAIQVAHDAARRADNERERYYKLYRELEQQKRDIADKEHNYGLKEEELHQELLSYRIAERSAQEEQQRAKLAEQYFHNKAAILQQRTNEIAEKETMLSQERLLLSQDRIALHALKNKLHQQLKCCERHNEDNKLTDYPNINDTNEPTKDNNLYGNTPLRYQGDMVDHILDANIAESIRKMNSNKATTGWESLLDDDHKNFVQSNIDNGLDQHIPGGHVAYNATK